jgi:hypothetical protein
MRRRNEPWASSLHPQASNLSHPIPDRPAFSHGEAGKTTLERKVADPPARLVVPRTDASADLRLLPFRQGRGLEAAKQRREPGEVVRDLLDAHRVGLLDQGLVVAELEGFQID